MAAQGVPARVATQAQQADEEWGVQRGEAPALVLSLSKGRESEGHAQVSTRMNIHVHVAPEFQREASERVAAASGLDSEPR